MKTKHFYSHLVETTDITLEIAGMDLAPDERVHLISLMEANIHSVVIKSVLKELPKEEKKVFLKNLVEEDHEKIWQHLKKTSKGVEEKIRLSLEGLKKELLNDVKNAKAK